MTAYDAYAAKAWSSTLDVVIPDPIGVIGWSHGGTAVLAVVDSACALQREVVRPGTGARPDKVGRFKVAVAFYPYAHSVSEPDTPLLVLIGARDDIFPARLTPGLKLDYAGSELERSLTKYPDSCHAFDVEAVGEQGLQLDGHHLRYDPRSTADALQRTSDFLRKYIGARDPNPASPGWSKGRLPARAARAHTTVTLPSHLDGRRHAVP